MMTVQLDPAFLKVLSALETHGLPDPSYAEIQKAVDEVWNTLEKGLSLEDFKLYDELEKIQQFIELTKNELRSIQPQDISKTYIPTAKDELSAVVEATEEATGTILDAIEAIEAIVLKMPKEEQTEIQSHITRVYEACNFQDITGQRIKKVTNTLKYIDEKICDILDTFKSTSKEEPGTTPPQPKPVDNGQDKYLNGPQLPQQAKTQDDIDALFAS